MTEPIVGHSLGHYRIESKLGEGGMGVVWKARDMHLDRFVALKVLPSEKLGDPDRQRRFVQEAKAASALNHPNIITVYEISFWKKRLAAAASRRAASRKSIVAPVESTARYR